MAHALVEAARALDPLIRREADAAETQRQLTAPVVEAITRAGLHRLLVPKAYGGPEADPLTFMECIETLAASDGATGWVANIWSTTSSMAWFVSQEWGRELFHDPNTRFAGAFAPNGRAENADGGWYVSGRWMWGSGAATATWVNGGTMCDDGMHLMFFRASDVTFHDTWHSSGLRGTGSGDFEVQRAFVPKGREVLVGRVGPQVEGALGQFPNFGLLACGLAAVCIGIGRRAVDEAVALAGGKTPAGTRKPLSEYPPAQMNLATAEAALGSARAFLFDEVAKAWDAAQRGERASLLSKSRLRLAAAHAASEAARATDLAYNVGGGSSVFATSPLQRCFRDVHTATAHQQLSDRNILTHGRIMLGQEPEGMFI